jgi:putative membrane protein
MKMPWEPHPAPARGAQADRSANDLAEERTDLATERTMMAADRSLMAWIRTSLSMISFGFTIYKVLQSLASAGREFPHGGSPRAVGLFLTAMGTCAMVFGTIEYWSHLQSLRHYRDYPIWRPSFVIALLMSVFGVFLFLAITFGSL